MFCSIVFIPGLGGHPIGTWKQRKESYLWIKETLAERYHSARILTYGHGAQVLGNSFQSILDMGDRLKEALKLARQQCPVSEDAASSMQSANLPQARPVAFIAHSMGGLIFKRVRISSSYSSSTDICFQSLTEIRRAEDRHNRPWPIAGAIFLGVPNHGMKTSHLMNLVKDSPTESLIRSLDRDSQQLREIHERFSEQWSKQKFEIYYGYETEESPLVVDVSSAHCLRDLRVVP